MLDHLKLMGQKFRFLQREKGSSVRDSMSSVRIVSVSFGFSFYISCICICYYQALAAHPSSSSSGTPDSVPYPVYAEILRICDKLQSENQQLKKLVDSIFEDARDSPLNQNPSILICLEALAKMANDRLSTMVPYHDRESQLVVLLITDELQRILTQLCSEDGGDFLIFLLIMSWTCCPRLIFISATLFCTCGLFPISG